MQLTSSHRESPHQPCPNGQDLTSKRAPCSWPRPGLCTVQDRGRGTLCGPIWGPPTNRVITGSPHSLLDHRRGICWQEDTVSLSGCSDCTCAGSVSGLSGWVGWAGHLVPAGLLCPDCWGATGQLGALQMGTPWGWVFLVLFPRTLPACWLSPWCWAP